MCMCVCVCACLCKCVQVDMCAFACIGQRTTLATISQQLPTVGFGWRVSLHSGAHHVKLRGLANSSKDLSVSTYPMALGLWAHAIVPSFVLVSLSAMGFKESNSGPHGTRHFTNSYHPSPWEVSKGQIVRAHAPSLTQPAKLGI